MKINLKKRHFVLAVLALILVLIARNPRRAGDCMGATVRYFTRQYRGRQQSAVSAPVSNNQVRLLVNGNETLPVMLDLIANAKRIIRWQVMLFQPDEVARELVDSLAAAARRGVAVQLSFNIDQTVNGSLADGYSSETKRRLNQQMQPLLATLREAGVEVRDNPPGVNFLLADAGSRAQAIQQDIEQSVCIAANHYDHRKLFIVDDQMALIGGMNVGKHYQYHVAPDLTLKMDDEASLRRAQNLPEAWEKWLDVSITIQGPVIEELVDEFNWKWEVLGGKPLPYRSTPATPGSLAVQFLQQRPGYREIGARFFDLVENAHTEIWVASPFVSFEPAMDALMAASRRGVRVVFVYPNAYQEMPISGRIFREFVNPLLDAGVEVHFNDLRMAHTKLMVVDRQYTLVGSFNLNHRSFRHDMEIAALVDDSGFAAETVERVFQPYLSFSYPVRTFRNPDWKLLNWLARPFS